LKIALITDLHYGVRGDGQAFLDNNKKFFDHVFFPYLKDHNIKTVICLGDLLDRRKYFNYNTASRMRKDFIEPLSSYDFLWILGNHDIYFRQSNDVSAASELFSHTDHNFQWYKDPAEVIIGGRKILFVPWICDSNREQSEALIKSTDAKVLFGHLELTGFEMHKGQLAKDGESHEKYKKFDFVATGHYHHKSNFENIHYLGSHAEFTWSDYDDERGFHIFDTDTLALEFIPNPYKMFAKAFYDDSGSVVPPTHFNDLTGKIVKVIVKAQTNAEQFNWFISQIEDAKPLEMDIVQDHLNYDNITDESIVSESKDTLQIIRDVIANANNVVNASKLDKMVTELYQEALLLE